MKKKKWGVATVVTQQSIGQIGTDFFFGFKLVFLGFRIVKQRTTRCNTHTHITHLEVVLERIGHDCFMLFVSLRITGALT